MMIQFIHLQCLELLKRSCQKFLEDGDADANSQLQNLIDQDHFNILCSKAQSVNIFVFVFVYCHKIYMLFDLSNYLIHMLFTYLDKSLIGIHLFKKHHHVLKTTFKVIIIRVLDIHTTGLCSWKASSRFGNDITS